MKGGVSHDWRCVVITALFLSYVSSVLMSGHLPLLNRRCAHDRRCVRGDRGAVPGAAHRAV